jgi:hypothetical protein
VEEMLLATIVGAAINRFMVMIFTLGDGVFSTNGKIRILNENNIPSYIAYGTYPDKYHYDREKLDFQVQAVIAVSDFKSLIIATDGAAKIQEKADELLWIVGENERVKGLSQFEEEEKYFKNHFNLQRRLSLLNSEKTVVAWETQRVKKFRGILSDDTTIILIRRR